MRNDFLNVAGILLSGAALLALTGCGTLLSGSGPSTDDVIAQSTSPGVQRYEIVDINSSVLDILRHRGPDSFLTHFGDYRPSVEPKSALATRFP